MVDNSSQGGGLRKKQNNQTTPPEKTKTKQPNNLPQKNPKQWQQQQSLEAREGGKIPSALFLPIQPSTISSHGQDLKKQTNKKDKEASEQLSHTGRVKDIW